MSAITMNLAVARPTVGATKIAARKTFGNVQGLRAALPVRKAAMNFTVKASSDKVGKGRRK